MATNDDPILLTEYGKRLTTELTAAQAGRLAQLPPEELTVQLGPEPGTYWLTAGDRIGVIFSEGVHIRIEPKVPIANLFYMLTYAKKLDYFRDQQAPLGPSEDLFAFIVQMFVSQVDRIVRQGIQRGYIDLEETHPYLRGRLLLGDHLRRTVVRPGLFHQRTNEFTADLPENRILHETLNRLGRAPGLGSPLRRHIRRAASAFAEVPYAAVKPADCDQVIYTRLNERYRPAVMLARLLLQYLSLESHTGRTPFATYLLPMHTIFEEFVAAYMTEVLIDRPGIAGDQSGSRRPGPRQARDRQARPRAAPRRPPDAGAGYEVQGLQQETEQRRHLPDGHLCPDVGRAAGGADLPR